MVRAFLIACVCLAGPAAAQDLSQVSLPADLVPADAKVTHKAIVTLLEGPAVDADGTVYFSDVAGNRIFKMTPDGKTAIFRADSGRTNGNCFDAQGRLVSCEGGEQGPGRRRIVRTDLKTGQVEVLSDRFEGKRYNSPNDLCIDLHGNIWFTDPRYSPDRSDLEMDVEGVYCIHPDGKVRRAIDPAVVQKPNGIAITPDGKTLYVVDSNPREGGNRKVWAFPVGAGGAVGQGRVVYDFGQGRGGDGLKLDVKGNLWVAAGISYRRSPGESTDVPPGIYVISPQGKLLGRIPVGEDLITNLAFGGPDRKTLYITAGKTLYQVRVNVAGYALYPPLK